MISMIAMRSHHDTTEHYDDQEQPQKEEGKFKNLVKSLFE